MKKYILLCLMLGLGAGYAYSWTFLTEAENRARGLMLPKLVDKQGNMQACIQEERAWFSAEDRQEKMDTFQKICNRKFSEYEEYKKCIDEYIQKYNEDVERFKQLYQETEPMVSQIYTEWVTGVRQTIMRAGRSEEFRDVLNLLPSQVTFSFFNEPAKADKTVVLCDRNRSNEAIDLFLSISMNDDVYYYNGVQDNLGATDTSSSPRRNTIKFAPASNKELRPWALDVLLHEAGHTLGLSEMYQANNPYDSKVFTMDKFQQRNNKIPSVMNKAKYAGAIRGQDLSYVKRENKVTCDDVDGIINIMDHYFPKRMSERRTQGWLSLCPNQKIAYAYSLPFEVTDAEIARQKAFMAGGRQGVAPLQGHALEVAKSGAAVDERLAQEAAAAEQKDKEQRAKREKEQLKQALEDAAITQKAEREMKKAQAKTSKYGYECPVCHQEFEQGDPVVTKCSSKSNETTRRCVKIHSHCKESFPGFDKIGKSYISIQPKPKK